MLTGDLAFFYQLPKLPHFRQRLITTLHNHQGFERFYDGASASVLVT